jgi:hypothetical protein
LAYKDQPLTVDELVARLRELRDLLDKVLARQAGFRAEQAERRRRSALRRQTLIERRQRRLGT